MNRLSALPDDILLKIERLAKRGKVRSTKPRKFRTNYPASTHDLRNLPLTKNKYERVLDYLNKQLPVASNQANRWGDGSNGNYGFRPNVPNTRIIDFYDNSGYQPYHHRALRKALTNAGFKRNWRQKGQVYVRNAYSLAPTSKRFRDLPRPRSSNQNTKSKRARSASPIRRRARARGDFSI